MQSSSKQTFAESRKMALLRIARARGNALDQSAPSRPLPLSAYLADDVRVADDCALHCSAGTRRAHTTSAAQLWGPASKQGEGRHRRTTDPAVRDDYGSFPMIPRRRATTS